MTVARKDVHFGLPPPPFTLNSEVVSNVYKCSLFIFEQAAFEEHRRPRARVSCWNLGSTAAVAHGSWSPPRAPKTKLLLVRTVARLCLPATERAVYTRAVVALGRCAPRSGEGRLKSDCLMRGAAAAAVTVAERPAQRIW